MGYLFPRANSTRYRFSYANKRDIIHRIKIKAKKFYYRNATNYPFISGDSIANCTDYTVFGRNNDEPIDIDRLRSARSIFLSGHKLNDLLCLNFNDITAEVLVTVNSDENFQDPILLPESIKLWLSQNNAIKNDERIFPLPIGIENKRLGRSGIESLHHPIEEFSITTKILLPPMSPTNPVRTFVLDWALKNPDLFDAKTTYLPVRKYFKLTRQYKFIFCCEGNGFENHRIWEALYQNSFPVMLESKWASSLKVLNLPILFITSLDQLNESILSDFLDKNRNFNSTECPQLWVDFWKNKINSAEIKKVKVPFTDS